jgi:hypothetical protein
MSVAAAKIVPATRNLLRSIGFLPLGNFLGIKCRKPEAAMQAQAFSAGRNSHCCAASIMIDAVSPDPIPRQAH